MNARSPEAIAVIALGLLALVTSTRSPAAVMPGATALGGRVARMRTAPATRSQWIGTRLAAARSALVGVVPEASRESIARDFVAHWIREVGPQDTTPTGATAEFCFNVGNVIAPASYAGSYYVSSAGHKFKAFATLPIAVANYLALVSGGRYAQSWAQLLTAPDDIAAWNVALVGEGYESASTANLAEVARELPQNRASVDAWVASHG